MRKLPKLWEEPDLTHFPYFYKRSNQIFTLESENHKLFHLKNNQFKLMNEFEKKIRLKRSGYLLKFNKPKIFMLGTYKSQKNSKKEKESKLLVIYIDGFSSFINEETNHLRILMPHLNKILKEFTIFTKYYATAEWTLPNYASIMTSELQNKHLQYFSAKTTKEKTTLHKKIIHEKLKKHGLTSNVISSIPYVNPNFGFHRGTENFIYGRNLNSNGIIKLFKMLENSERKQEIMWLHFMDIHHNLEDVSNINIENKISIINKLILEYDFTRKDAINFIKRASKLDESLKYLFEQVETKKYKNIIFVSDHGSTRLKTDINNCLKDSRTRTTLFVKKYGSKKQSFNNEMCSHINFYEIISKLLDLKYKSSYWNLPNLAVILQSIYINQYYKLRIITQSSDLEYKPKSYYKSSMKKDLLKYINEYDRSMIKNLYVQKFFRQF